jgi:hypothetical protein
VLAHKKINVDLGHTGPFFLRREDEASPLLWQEQSPKDIRDTERRHKVVDFVREKALDGASVGDIMQYTTWSDDTVRNVVKDCLKLQRHHDHAADYWHDRGGGLSWREFERQGGRTARARFPDTIVCDLCNSADGAVKTVLGLPEQFSFAPAEIRSFVRATPHANRIIDFGRAQQGFDDLWTRHEALKETGAQFATQRAPCENHRLGAPRPPVAPDEREGKERTMATPGCAVPRFRYHWRVTLIPVLLVATAACPLTCFQAA